jgi:hypothetical protein
MSQQKVVWSALAALVLLAGGASAAVTPDDGPTGTWKWSVDRNGQKIETVLKLKLDGEKLTGTIAGRDGKDTEIEEPSYKDGEVKFSISRDRNGTKTTTKYAGKLSGDTITGTAATGDRSREWKAERSK